MKVVTATALLEHVQPLVDGFARDLAKAMACSIAEMRERAMAAARATIEAELEAKPTSETKRGAAKRRRTKTKREPRDRARPPKAATSSPKTAKTRPRAPRRCRKCGAEGFRSDGCGRTHNVKGAPSSDADAEDEPHGARCQAGERAAVEGRVIAVAEVVSRLAADRAAALGGDAGGYVARAVRGPSLVGRTEEKREMCPVHGWVGRVAFEREHFKCLPVGEPCTWCSGAKIRGSDLCDRCHGWGVEPARIEAPEIAEIERPLAAAHVKTIRVDGERARRGAAPRKRTISQRRIGRKELRVGGILNPPVDIPRPQTRADCLPGGSNVCRPCGWVTCKYHLYLDINPETGSITLNFPDIEPHEMIESCALDIAERGGLTLEDVGNLTNLTRERVHQVEVRGLLALRATREVKQIGPGPFVERGDHPIAEAEES